MFHKLTYPLAMCVSHLKVNTRQHPFTVCSRRLLVGQRQTFSIITVMVQFICSIGLLNLTSVHCQWLLNGCQRDNNRMTAICYHIFQITSRAWFNIKMSYQYRKSQCGDKMVVKSSYLHNRISYTCKTSSLYWIGSQNLYKRDRIAPKCYA